LPNEKPFLTLLPLAPTPLRGFSATPTPFPGVEILNLLTVGIILALALAGCDNPAGGPGGNDNPYDNLYGSSGSGWPSTTNYRNTVLAEYPRQQGPVTTGGQEQPMREVVLIQKEVLA
jgi:hypothetical protein